MNRFSDIIVSVIGGLLLVFVHSVDNGIIQLLMCVTGVMLIKVR